MSEESDSEMLARGEVPAHLALPPGGESDRKKIAGMQEAINALKRERDELRTLAVAHEGVLRSIFGQPDQSPNGDQPGRVDLNVGPEWVERVKEVLAKNPAPNREAPALAPHESGDRPWHGSEAGPASLNAYFAGPYREVTGATGIPNDMLERVRIVAQHAFMAGSTGEACATCRFCGKAVTAGKYPGTFVVCNPAPDAAAAPGMNSAVTTVSSSRADCNCPGYFASCSDEHCPRQLR